ncbi:MAG: 7-cyano-7-deazaguanine synthase [Firmicutes bacterium]|nr:7-cyano-7-deazaguanine synthase [Bacillota bacterium]
MKKALVLSSGGADSATCLALAVERFGCENVTSLAVYYGQRHDREIIAARKLSEYYGVSHIEKDMTDVFVGSKSTLLKSSEGEIKPVSYEEQARDGEVDSYVPFRNGLFASCAAAEALSLYPDADELFVYLGIHGDSGGGSAYADCTPEFAKAMGRAVSLGTYGRVTLEAPFAGGTKADVIKEGLRLHVPYELTWSCYLGGDLPCGVCATCRDRILAFQENGASDPLIYENEIPKGI